MHVLDYLNTAIGILIKSPETINNTSNMYSLHAEHHLRIDTSGGGLNVGALFH